MKLPQNENLLFRNSQTDSVSESRMNMYGYDVSFYDYGFSDPAITTSLYGSSFSPMAAAIDYDDGVYVRRRPPPRIGPSTKNPSSPPKHRRDGTSPLPLGMDWSLPPRVWVYDSLNHSTYLIINACDCST